MGMVDHGSQAPTGCLLLAALLARCRRARGLSQKRLAELASTHRPGAPAAADITGNQIAQWENGHRRISAGDLVRLELALNVIFEGVAREVPSLRHGHNWCETGPDRRLGARCRSTRRRLVWPDDLGELVG